jgi:predicted Zn-dependent protease
MGQDADAIVLLNRVQPHDVTQRILILHHLGQLYTRTNQAEEARKAFEQLTLLQQASSCVVDAGQHPQDLTFQVRAAEALTKAGAPEDAADFLERAFKTATPNRAAMRLLADSQERAGRTEPARISRAAAEKLP